MKQGAADDLHTPLGTKPPRRGRPLPLLGIAGGALVLIAAVSIGWIVLFDDPSGGDPVARVKVDNTASAVVSGNSVAQATGIGPVAASAPNAPAARAEAVGPNRPKVIRVPDPVKELPERPDGEVVIHDLSGASQIALSAAPDDALIEPTPDGIIPRVSSDGRRPMDQYARPADSLAIGTARVAIVVGGLGISDAGTETAIASLPGPVTLAFAPYGADLDGWVAKARALGHEILLQLPLEPFDYPNNDPGPKTLLVDASAAENTKRLHWLMSRFSTYVGVVNYMGGRFTAEPKAMEPVLAEIGSRGLLYLDDGTSTRSRAREASHGRVPFAGADLVIDAQPDPAAIANRLAQLEAIARERGQAVGIATAYPVTVAQIATWAKDAARRGVVLVPVSAVASSNPS